MQPTHGQAKHFLYQGAIFVSREPLNVITILGSCISVCLWDTVLKFGGMNHYLLPFWNGEGLTSSKYGNIAIEKLIDKMCASGSVKKNLQAKIFGGAQQFNLDNESTFKIGETNISLAFSKLGQESIPVVKYSVGGSRGRKIIFITGTGEILMKYVGYELPPALSITHSQNHNEKN